MRSKQREVGSGTLTSQCEGGAGMLPFLYSIASLTVKHASAMQGKLGEAGSRVRGALTCSMFGNLTGTYPRHSGRI